MRKSILCLAVAAIGVLPLSVQAAESRGGFSAEQRKEIESIIKDYVTEKDPEILGIGLRNLEKRRIADARAKTEASLVSNKEKIFRDPATPYAGNPAAKVVIAWFYDYQCGYCKVSDDALSKILKEEKDVKVIYKNYPVLGPVSMEASKAALASAKQGKFMAFHSALMSNKERLSSDSIIAIAKKVGLDVAKLKKDMADKKLDDELQQTMQLGQELGVQGTPFFAYGNDFNPGVMRYNELMQVVTDVRKGTN